MVAITAHADHPVIPPLIENKQLMQHLEMHKQHYVHQRKVQRNLKCVKC